MHRYLVARRMDEAALMLESSDDAIARIATHVGYETTTAFSKVFKQPTASLPPVTGHAMAPAELLGGAERLPTLRLRGPLRWEAVICSSQAHAPIPQGVWRSSSCEDPPPKNKKQPQRRSPKPRREASARNPRSQESHPIPSLLCLFISRRD